MHMCSGVLPDAVIVNQLDCQCTYSLPGPWKGGYSATLRTSTLGILPPHF
jgi:hypothetical protein